jgi:hypothetical protein
LVSKDPLQNITGHKYSMAIGQRKKHVPIDAVPTRRRDSLGLGRCLRRGRDPA